MRYGKGMEPVNKKHDLRDLSQEEIALWLEGEGEKPYRAAQIVGWLFDKKVRNTEEMSNLSLSLRTRLASSFSLNNLTVMDTQVSRDGTIKYLYGLADGKNVESVLIPDGPRLTLCVSTQVGCKLGCTFCRTGDAGFIRNLLPHEILGQVIETERLSENRITNLVLMGMGEPLDNYENVVKSLNLLHDPGGMRYANRKVTLSTAGMVSGIRRLAKEGVKTNLAISLNATTDSVRSKIMPINRKFPIADLLDACRSYPLPRGRRITFEYVMLDGINDSPEDAKRLAGLVRGIPCKINLIPFNRYTESPYRPSPPARVEQFQKILVEKHLSTFIRKSKGGDILAACGQLQQKFLEPAETS